MVKIEEIRGSIFDSKCQTIVNTVNCKGFMGKGLALEFRYRYPKMFEVYRKQCEHGEIKTGKLTIWKEATPWIINFPTKDDWKKPSKMEYIENGLDYLIKHYKEWGIKSIAFPWLGSRHGGLNWQDVRKNLYCYLEITDLEIQIYEFDKNFQDNLFILLQNRLREMNLKDYVETIGLRLTEAKILKTAFENELIPSFYYIQNLMGFGEKSIEKIYRFIKDKSHSKQQKLVLD